VSDLLERVRREQQPSDRAAVRAYVLQESESVSLRGRQTHRVLTVLVVRWNMARRARLLPRVSVRAEERLRHLPRRDDAAVRARVCALVLWLIMYNKLLSVVCENDVGT
jgi:hypothetical protein